MRYALLIYTAEATEALDPEAMTSELVAYNAFTADIRARGVYEAGEALHPTTAATTVRVEGGRILATDGPFAETKEALGGIYIVHAADLDEAIAFAARIPGASHGCVEVRPIWELPGMGASQTAEAVVAS